MIEFSEHKETTARDCEAVSEILIELAGEIRNGDMKAFERFWIVGGTEEGDARINAIREMITFRYLAREESILKGIKDGKRKVARKIGK